MHANDAPVSYPPVWTVPWLWWAQYDASIEQPLIRNAGEALGVRASLNLSPDFPSDRLFRSSVALENLLRIEKMLRGSDPFSRTPKSFGGLTSPKWPSHLFPDDPAWKINPDRVARGRALYAKMCAECHLGPVADPAFDAQFRTRVFGRTSAGSRITGRQLDPERGHEERRHHGNGSRSGQRAGEAAGSGARFPEDAARGRSRERWKCKDLPTYSSTEMPFSIALMIMVDRVSRKWLDDRGITDPKQIKEVWGERTNCPNLEHKKPQYRARPLNGVWATAPYIHNGSVPSLYWMLMPQNDRPKQFCLGARDFDPKTVGFDVPAERRIVMQDRPDPVLDDGQQRQEHQGQQRARPFL